MSGARNQQVYIKPEVSGFYINNLDLNVNKLFSNINTTGTIVASNIIYNTGNNSIDGTLTANNLVYNTGNQTISGIKTFANDMNVSGTGTFNGLNLENINTLTLSGMNINITGNSVLNIFNDVKISGNPVLTGIPDNSWASQTEIDSLSGLFTGFTGNLDATYATDAQLISTGSRVDTLSGNLITTGSRVDTLSGQVVLTTGDQTISGSKTFINNQIFSGDIGVSGASVFNSVNLNNIDELNLSGIDITITSGNVYSNSEIIGSNLIYNTGNQTISGNKTFTNNIIYSVSPRTSGISFTPNADLYTFFDYILTGNSTLNAPTNMVNGESITIFLNQDASGGRNISFNNAYLFSNGINPSLNFVPSGVDIMQVIRVNNRYFCSFASNY